MALQKLTGLEKKWAAKTKSHRRMGKKGLIGGGRLSASYLNEGVFGLASTPSF
jgi:hypothetical protein